MEQAAGQIDLQAHAAFHAEAVALENATNYAKAMQAYDKAIEAVSPNGVLSPKEAKLTLTCRSRLHLQLGNYAAALKDAEDSLLDDGSYIRGLFAKAEALYFKSDFEFALIFYHRGNKLRPELNEFKLGISKAIEAVENAVGSTASCDLTGAADITDFWVDDGRKKARKGLVKPPASAKHKASAARAGDKAADKSAKQLLGDLYADKVFLESLLADTTFTAPSETEVRALIQEGLDYLDKRTEFWRQQKPIYVREHEAKVRKRDPALTKRADDTAAAAAAVTAHKNSATILHKLDLIERATSDDDADTVVAQGTELLSLMTDEVPDSVRITGEVLAMIGNAHLLLGSLSHALEAHNKDLDNALTDDARSRALGNVGRTYACMGQYEKAIEHWLDKVPLCSAPLESAWLNHEIGRAYLELGKGLVALEFAQKAQASAAASADPRWVLYADILLAQAHLLVGDVADAHDAYTNAKAAALLLHDSLTLAAVEAAVEDVYQRMVGFGGGGDSGGGDPAADDQHGSAAAAVDADP